MRRRFSTPYFHLVHSCWHYAGHRRGQMLLFYALTVLANVAAITQPFIIGKLINGLQEGGPALLHRAIYWLGIYVALMFIFWLFHGPSRVIERNVAFHAKQNFLQHYYRLLVHLPMHWHRDHHTGNTMNRINKASQGLYIFSDMQFIYIEGIVRITGAFAMLAWFSQWIALAEILFAAVIIGMLMRFDRSIIRVVNERNEREHEYNSVFFDYLGNIVSVISFNLFAYTRTQLGKALGAIHAPLKQEIILNELKWFIMMMLIVIAEFVIMILYIRRELSGSGALMLGSLVAVYQYMNSLNWVFFSFATNYERLIQQHTDLAAVEPLLESYESHAMHDEGKPDLKVTEGTIRFDHIHFSYKSGLQIFDGFNLSIPAHQKVGLVGRSGVGKTTLIHLLLRFYDAQTNRIYIDDQNISEVTHASLCRQIAVIPQDTSLFEATLMENIRFGKLDATDSEVMQAAAKAHAHEFITLLPEGYQAMVGERGVKLSAGQRQRIAIARAILKNAPILVLDEATSALDSQSEQFIQDSLHQVMEGKTVIAVAHRLSTIAHLDRLIVLDAGRIVEDGSHSELLAKGGYYAKLWGLQSGGFLPD